MIIIKNQGRVDYKYKLSDTSPTISKTILSNTVSTNVISTFLKMIKCVNKPCAVVFDVLTYKIIIYNESSKDMTNLFFKDTLQKGLKFIKNSVKLNNKKELCIDPNKGFNIDIIPANSKITITFKAVILPKKCTLKIKNSSLIYYNLLYNIELPPAKIPLKSNTVSTSIINKLFKQFTINNIISIPFNFPKIDEILKVKVKIKILNKKVIKSVFCDKSNKSRLYKLIVIGSIEYYVFYRSYKNLYCFKEIRGFSTYLLTPYGIEFFDLNTINLNLDIENISLQKLNSKTTSISTTLLINCP